MNAKNYFMFQKILTSPCTAEKGYEIEFLKYAVGNGLLSAPGKWI